MLLLYQKYNSNAVIKLNFKARYFFLNKNWHERILIPNYNMISQVLISFSLNIFKKLKKLY